MHLNRISITRQDWYSGSHRMSDPSKPLQCTVEVAGPMGKTELNLPADVSDRIVALIADELAQQGKRVAEAMTAKFFDATAVLTDQSA